LSYDHKGSDENEGKRIANAGGLILNNRVNGVLAVTRALGDAYLKDLVTGHPYTTETVIQPDADEFIILACDGVSVTLFNPNVIRKLMYPIAVGCLQRPRSRGPDPNRPRRSERLQDLG
jgi:serine/threonine protein phosphatase PrpC